MLPAVLFGDSWVRDSAMVTWPELLGELLGWPTLNVALPGSHSGTLALQYELLQRMLSAQSRQVHPEAWALVHAGGNDLLHSSPQQILAVVAKVLCCGMCLPCVSQLASLDVALLNMRELLTRLRDVHGVRNVMLCGLPLCVHMPLVGRYLQMLLGTGPIITCMGTAAVSNINWLFLRKLEALGRDLGMRVVTLDEAKAIGEVVAETTKHGGERRRQLRTGERKGDGADEDTREDDDVSAVSDGGGSAAGMSEGENSESGSADGSAAGGRGAVQGYETGALLRGRSPEDLWADMLHPSQRCHTALSVAMFSRFNQARGSEAGDGTIATRAMVMLEKLGVRPIRARAAGGGGSYEAPAI